mmetsp:Transcript_44078/g.136584  ORF Transcript_44078/g.136584 Transcript_44078/m.136584 type:complete len:610 (-) Transcript_44078:310-2139(-)
MQRLREPGCLVRSYRGDKSLRAVYDVDDEALGEGRYSRVFGATHRATGARRAVKTADKQGVWTQYVDLGMECPGRLACHEAEILKRLDHPNVIRILEVYEEKNSVHLVLELCEGGDVLERILVSNGRLPESDIATLFAQMLFAVSHLHQNGVVHRDLKPEHFLFTRREPAVEPRPPQEATMKLIDFGLSHKVGVTFAPEGGTPQFMSPEAKSGHVPQDLADRGDMWSLGVVLHAMLVGHYPSPHLTDQKQGKYFAQPSWKGVSSTGIDLIGLLLRQAPSSRPTAADALKHPWSKQAIAKTVTPPEPLLRGTALAIKSYIGANALRKLALLAAAREVDDRDVTGLRQALQTLELRCEGQLARKSLLRAAGADGALGEGANALFRSFDAIVGEGGSGILGWTEMVALYLSSAPTSKEAASKASGTGPVPLLRDEACWRAFDLLSQSGGTVTAPVLDQLLGKPRASGSSSAGPDGRTAAAGNGNGHVAPGGETAMLQRLVTEVFPSGGFNYTDFLRLVSGQLQRKPGIASFIVHKLRYVFRARKGSRSNSTPSSSSPPAPRSNSGAASGPAPGAPARPEASPNATCPAAPASTPPSAEKKTKRRSMLGMSTL